MPAAPSTPPPRFGASYGSLLADGWRLVRKGGARIAGFILVSQLIILGVALPVIGWLFREALRAGGMHGLDLGQLSASSGLTVTVGLIAVIIAVSFVLLALQFSTLVLLLRSPGIEGRALLAEIGRVARKLFRRGGGSLLIYLFLLVPLSGFGFASALTRGIAIPRFVSGELLKSSGGAIALGVVVIVLLLLNWRLSLTVPVFALTTGGRAARSSWRMTRGLRSSLPLVLVVLTVLAFASVSAFALAVIAIVPTAVSDALSPGASPVIAAYSLGAAQVAGMLLSGFATAWIAAILLVKTLRSADRLAPGVRIAPVPGSDTAVREISGGRGAAGTAGLAAAPAQSGASESADPAKAADPAARPRSRNRLGTIVAAFAVVMAIGFGTAGIGTLRALSDAPQSLVLAHRGFSDGGVENTISGLASAASAGADLVEMDVMQTADGEFVAMHDTNLERLAGRPVSVRDMTLQQLTRTYVHDNHGNTDKIPSFSDYVVRAQQLGMPLLIEIKLSGAETADHVERLVSELESLDALEGNIYHSLDAPSVERLKLIRPDLTVGYTMALAGVSAPETPADFIVVEQWTASAAMQRSAEAAGLGFMVWTVNDDAGMREHLRRGADGIISDHPDRVLLARSEMQQETGLAEVLVDAITRFVTVV